ncbi:MAG: carbamoyltransferase HypF, partial [Fulvivirga sp.]
ALGLIDICTYEGEAAMILESTASYYGSEEPVNYLEGLTYTNVPTVVIIKEVMQAASSGEAIRSIARNFLFTLASCVVYMANKYEIKTIALSGGVFQNTILLDFLFALTQNKFKLLMNQQLSPNDENISLGQVFYYENIKE